MPPPLLPKVDTILVVDSKGDRHPKRRTAHQSFEPSIEIGGIAARPDAADVVTVFGKTAVFCGGSAPGQGGGSVRVVHIGPAGESKLVLAHLVEGMYDALNGHKLASSVLLRDEQEATRAEEQAQSK
ncbi:LOW QUALITY PROTEIN: hypothetical protein HJC23_011775 [Cyclotella cryptica]|uniref:Dinitrogenase iron-molybdenum cofactor biosynthesis domain-containing protein n=1 Tax=Cyclotella cryptica TaxID=29204 RepID=A0ABD3PIN9_9STRA